MKDVMIDFETFGAGPNAVVVQIGACYFDRETGEIGKKLKINVDAEDAFSSGGDIDAGTVYWWLMQSPEAIRSISSLPRSSISAAFVRLNEFLEDADFIWSHATFDFVILSQTLKRLGIKPSFSYRCARDIRTLLDLSEYSYATQREGTAHDAMDDCVFQVGYTVGALRSLKK